MEIAELIKNPQLLDRDTLYELRSTLALYPYFQNARLLLLKNLYLLHDPSFDEELRRAAIYITDRKVLFQMIEARHYRLRPQSATNTEAEPTASTGSNIGQASTSRTISLIDNFLESLPKTEDDDNDKKTRRKPTPADASVDYVAYLLETEGGNEEMEEEKPQLRGQDLIDNFINIDKGRIVLKEEPTMKPDLAESTPTDGKEEEMEFGTETLARIYIKQGRYSSALEIIRRLSLENPKKNAYFADQIRFLQKLIINNKH